MKRIQRIACDGSNWYARYKSTLRCKYPAKLFVNGKPYCDHCVIDEFEDLSESDFSKLRFSPVINW